MRPFQALVCAISVCFFSEVQAKESSGVITDSKFFNKLNSPNDIPKITGIEGSINRVAMHLGFQKGNYNSPLRIPLLNDIGAGGAATLNVAKLTKHGLAPEIIDVLTDSGLSEQRQYAKFLFVVEESDLKDDIVRNMLRQLASGQGEKTFSLVLLKELSWEVFATELALRSAVFDEFDLDIFLKEGGAAERRIVLDIITHSRYRNNLNRFGIHLGLNHLPMYINAVGGHLAATEIASLLDKVLLLNRYADFEISIHTEPSIYLAENVEYMKRFSPEDIQKVSADSALVSDRVTSYKEGKAHVNNEIKIPINISGEQAPSFAYLSVLEGILTITLDMPTAFYNEKYLTGQFFIDFSVGQHRFNKNNLKWNKLESPVYPGRSLMTAELDLNSEDRFASLANADYLDVQATHRTFGLQVKGLGQSRGDLKLLIKSELQVENRQDQDLELNQSELAAVKAALRYSKSNKVDLSIKPQNQRIGNRYNTVSYGSKEIGIREIKQYQRYLSQINKELREKKAIFWASSQGCRGIFGQG